MVDAYGISNKGLVRKTNEDSFVCSPDLGLFVVADGMGGHSAGEVASRLAIDAIEGFMRRSHGEAEYSWPYGIDPQLSVDANRLRTAIHLANRRVFRAAESHDDYTGMGTTVVSALVTGETVVIGHVGDSRLYRMRRGTLETMTSDDTWVATVLAHDPGADAAALAQHPMRHVLTSVVGAREQVEVHMVEVPVEPGDLFMLCSDGLHGLVDGDTLAALLAADGSLPAIAAGLVQAALERGGNDNVTAVVARCPGTA